MCPPKADENIQNKNFFASIPAIFSSFVVEPLLVCDRRYLAGDEYTIADMASYPWTVGWESQGIDINEFKYFKRWFEELSERPALQQGMAVGSDLTQDYSKISDEDKARIRALLYNQRARPAPETGGIE